MHSLEDFLKLDIHYHANPDLYLRRHTALIAGKTYADYQSAVVLTSHLGSTAVQAIMAQELGYPVLGSLVMNQIAGGLDFRIILRALLEYRTLIPARLLVHFPTITGRQYTSRLSRELTKPNFAKQSMQPVTLFNESHQLKAEVKEIIRLAANEPIVLSTGHAGPDEIYAVVEEIERFSQVKLLINQPAHPLTKLNAAALIELAKNEHVFFEQTTLTYLLGYQDEHDFAQVLQQVPRLIYSSDLGQLSQMDIHQYMLTSENYFKQFALSDDRKQDICKNNPVRLLSL